MTIQSIDLLTLSPTLVVAVGALLALVAELVTGRGQVALGVGLTALVVATPLAVLASGEQTLCNGADAACAYVVSPLAVALQLIVLVSTAVVLLMASGDVSDGTIPGGEFVFLILCSASGAVLVPATTDLVTLIVALEVVSLPTFALVALRRGEPRAAEAALKAFIFSIVSVAVSLYGISLLYGTTGVVSFEQLAAAATLTDPTPLGTAGLVMVLAVIGFKIAAVPFHAWAPDTYQGATAPVAAYLSVVSKTAGFAALLLVTWTFAGWSEVWAPVVGVLAGLTMLIGNAVALKQRHAVRLLAWSSIAQAGYILVPLGAVTSSVVWGPEVTDAVIGYLVAYAAMNLGAFAVVSVVARRDGAESLADYRGLAWRSPWLAVSLAFFLASLAGLPPGLIGLLVKVRVLVVPVDAGLWWLAVVMAVATVIGLAYYLVWAALLFARSETADDEGLTHRLAVRSWTSTVAVAVCVALTVAFSLAPSLALGLVDRL
ncbi:MAG: NADH-quinone oxidoreductase subunit N [Actinomycetia bacterium]|nr:NADH-quinone oxidoreductase subunit N [Actinomycetes bacterium]